MLEAWLRNCHSKYVVSKRIDVDATKIQEIGDHCYLVPSESKENISYIVDMSMRSCTCPMGRLRGPCKHKFIVSTSLNIASFDVIPTTNPVMRQLFMKIGCGTELPIDYFLPLQAPVNQLLCVVGPTCQEDVPLGALESLDVDNTTSEVDTELLNTKLCDALDLLKDKIRERIDCDQLGYKKAVANFHKTVAKLLSKRDSALQKSLHTFGKSITQVSTSIAKIINLSWLS